MHSCVKLALVPAVQNWPLPLPSWASVSPSKMGHFRSSLRALCLGQGTFHERHSPQMPEAIGPLKSSQGAC